ncbi:MAG: DNRLRE domain-containing protein [Clostridiales bacterium]|nr:DNRLRE domain-containing protein [Clostridiales bacterium]
MPIVSILLSICFICCSIPVSAINNSTRNANNNGFALNDNDSIYNDSENNHYEVKEIESLRESNVKHFQLEDGTYQAVSYSFDVHRKDSNGKWIDIDNRLKSDGKGKFVTNDYFFSFADNSCSDTLFSVLDGEYSISFGIEGINNFSLAAIKNHDNNQQGIDDLRGEEKLEALMRIDNTTTVKYVNVYDGIDLDYTISGNDVKENIIINERNAKNTFRFKLNLEGLSAIKSEKDGSILLIDELGNECYTITAPYMYDSSGETSNDVFYILEKVNDEYIITIDANESWINDENRVFPVVVDPSVQKTISQDTYIISQDPNTTHGSSTRLLVGIGEISYFRTSMPVLAPNAKITKAFFRATYYFNVTSGYMDIGVYRCMQSWGESYLTWNSANNLDNKGLATTCSSTGTATASVYCNENDPDLLSFNVTSIVQGWYAGDDNYGLALKKEAGPNNSVSFYSNNGASEYRPYFVIAYSLITPIIENGVFFIQNKQTGRFIDIENQNMGNGSYILQWDFNGDDSQKWIISYAHKENYYTLRSDNSWDDYYLGVKDDSTASSAKIVLRTGADSNGTVTITDGMLWSISVTDSGACMIKAVTGEANNRVLSLGWSLFYLNGVKLEQKDYSNDNDYLDEWFILFTDKSYSQITLHNESSISTSTLNNNVGLYYNQYAHVKGVQFSSITETDLVSHLKNDNYVCLITHGGQYEDKLLVNSNEILYLSELSSLSTSDFSNVKLIILSSCYSGRSGGFVDYFLSRGVDVVIGFTGSIEQNTTVYWTQQLIYHMTQGFTVYNSIQYANEDMVNYFDETELESVTSLIINGIYYGSSNVNVSLFD